MSGIDGVSNQGDPEGVAKRAQRPCELEDVSLPPYDILHLSHGSSPLLRCSLFKLHPILTVFLELH